ncbi:DUF6192 family protein [Streptomyces werraensis]
MRALSRRGEVPLPWSALGVVKAMSEETAKVDAVSQSRYDEIVAELRQVVEQQTRGSFTIGDRALEIEPMRERGGQHAAPGQELFTVREVLFRLAEDIGLAYRTVENARWTASRWPKEHRHPGVSFRVHRILGQIEDEAERFATIAPPPRGSRGERWTRPTAGWAARSSVRRRRRRRLPPGSSCCRGAGWLNARWPG